MKSFIIVFVGIIFCTTSHARSTPHEIEKDYFERVVKPEIEEYLRDQYPVTWAFYQSDKSITGLDQDDGYDLNEIFEAVFELENEIIDFEDGRSTGAGMQRIQRLNEEIFETRCADCRTYEEIQAFNNTYHQVLLRQTKWVKKNGRMTMIANAETPELHQKLLAATALHTTIQDRHEAEMRALYRKWVLENSERFQLIKDSHNYAGRIERSDTFDWVVRHLGSERVPVFNAVYEKDKWGDVGFARFRKVQAKKFQIFPGPTTENKTQYVDEAFTDMMRRNQRADYERLNCESGSTDSGSFSSFDTFDPEAATDLLFGHFDQNHPLARYRLARLSGMEPVGSISTIVNSEARRARDLPMEDERLQSNWPQYAKKGFDNLLICSLVGCSGVYRARNVNNQLTTIVKYRIAMTGADYEKIVNGAQVEKDVPPRYAGKRCKHIDEKIRAMAIDGEVLPHDPDLELGHLAVTRYEYDKSGQVVALKHAQTDVSDLRLGDVPDYVSKDPLPWALHARFKGQMLNGITHVSGRWANNSSLVPDTIPKMLLPSLKINGKSVYGYAATPPRFTRMDLSFRNNILHGPSTFFWINSESGEAGEVVVSFENGLSELDLKTLN